VSHEILQNVAVPAAQILLLLNVLLFAVAYLVLLERKIIAFMQVRLGPRRVGPHGLLQPVADILKLFIKEDIVPTRADRALFFLAPVLLVVPALVAFAVIPFSGTAIEVGGFSVRPWVADVNIGLIYVLAVSSLGVYGIVMAGWASNSKYPLLGSLRSAAQMISYEVPLALSVVSVLMLAGTASMVGIVRAQESSGVWYAFWFPYPQVLGLFVYFVSAVAETNRHPFDLPEAENELVAGFHTEYSGMKFALFFLAEYINMILVASVVTVLFLGGWLPVTLGIPGLAGALSNMLPFLGDFGAMLTGVFWFVLKLSSVLYFYLWIRATFPRYRYDQLMQLGWKWLLPAGLVHIVITAIAILATGR